MLEGYRASHVHVAWNNNDTGHWNVFFAKSTDGGNTLKIMMISTPQIKEHTIDQNRKILLLEVMSMLLGGPTIQELLCQYSEQAMITEIHLPKQ
jgi:hypothetical protein